MKPEFQKKFDDVRALFPHTENVTYFNTASYGPFSTRVRDAIQQNLDLRVASEIDDSHDTFACSEELRAMYARMIGAKASQIGLGMNTSFGLNVAAFGLPLKAGDEVMVANKEFPAIVYTWRAAAERRGLTQTFIPTVGDGFNVEAFRKAISKKTRVLSVSWVQFYNGYKNDLSELSEICRQHDIRLVVDGIQGMGAEPIDVHKLGIDVFTSGCQKWMLAPQGCGFFYLSDEMQQLIEAPFMSWLGVEWNMKFSDLFHYDRAWIEGAQRYELGYYVMLNLLGMRASAEIFLDLDIKNIQVHNHGLLDRLAEYLDSNQFYTVTSNREADHRSSILTFTSEGYRDLHRELTENKIICVPREGSIRISVHLFNNEHDIARLIDRLDRFAASRA
jgi:selenocysteine lyase/cysteine desulfurase